MVRGNRGSRHTEFLTKGLSLLVAEGPKALTASRVSRELNVTTGSFYWHFDSVADFQDAICNHWKDTLVPEIAKKAKELGGDDPQRTLAKLTELVQAREQHRLDDAMRQWAKTRPATAKAVRQVDRWRNRQLKQMMGNTDRAAEYADLVGASWRGTSGMRDSKRRFEIISLATEGVKQPR
jgi:AcrR family transcriptional regulator